MTDTLGFRRRCGWCGVQLRGWQRNLCRRCRHFVERHPSPPCPSGSRWDAEPDAGLTSWWTHPHEPQDDLSVPPLRTPEQIAQDDLDVLELTQLDPVLHPRWVVPEVEVEDGDGDPVEVPTPNAAIDQAIRLLTAYLRVHPDYEPERDNVLTEREATLVRVALTALADPLVVGQTILDANRERTT